VAAKGLFQVLSVGFKGGNGLLACDHAFPEGNHLRVFVLDGFLEDGQLLEVGGALRFLNGQLHALVVGQLAERHALAARKGVLLAEALLLCTGVCQSEAL
jgi:hypothetical protein